MERIDVTKGMRLAAAPIAAPARRRAAIVVAAYGSQAEKPSAHGPAQVCGGVAGFRTTDLGTGHLVWDRRPLERIGASTG